MRELWDKFTVFQKITSFLLACFSVVSLIFFVVFIVGIMFRSFEHTTVSTDETVVLSVLTHDEIVSVISEHMEIVEFDENVSVVTTLSPVGDLFIYLPVYVTSNQMMHTALEHIMADIVSGSDDLRSVTFDIDAAFINNQTGVKSIKDYVDIVVSSHTLERVSSWRYLTSFEDTVTLYDIKNGEYFDND